jgi:heme iron utilization protein
MSLGEKKREIQKIVTSLLESQKFGVLSTISEKNCPHNTLIAFFNVDPWNLVFATPKSTRKYLHIVQNNRVAFLFDNRKNKTEDLGTAISVEAQGSVISLNQKERSQLKRHFLKKHPYLTEFLHSPNVAMLKIQVKRYTVVQQFQSVTEWIKS